MATRTALPRTLAIGRVIDNQLSKESYRLTERLGEGGFGTAYAAERMSDGQTRDHVCVKVTTHAAGWHGEAYLGDFLRGESRAVQILDAFPFVWTTGRQRIHRRMLFAITSELMTEGTVADWCEKAGSPWPESRVRREIRLLLRTLDRLHVNGVSHRDITPGNVFIGPRSTLKLGDFGIAAMAKLYRGVRADAYNPAFKPPNVNAFWTQADDVYQVGILATTLLKREMVLAGMKKPAVNPLTPTDRNLRDVIKRAISSNRAERFQSAFDMAQALN